MRDDPLGPDYQYVAVDQYGRVQDIAALVTAVLSIRLHHPIHLTTDVGLTAAERQLVCASAEAGLEGGVMLAVHELFGQAVADAFRAHCDAVTQTLRLLDCARATK